MEDVDIVERARPRFVADRLPVSKRPVVVLEKPPGSDGLEETLEAETLILSLSEDATLSEAEKLARTLNERIERISAVE